MTDVLYAAYPDRDHDAEVYGVVEVRPAYQFLSEMARYGDGKRHASTTRASEVLAALQAWEVSP